MSTYVVSLEGFTGGARYDGLSWTDARIEQGDSADGPWVSLGSQVLAPDADPTQPATHDFTTTNASSPIGWFRVVFVDAAGHEQESGAVYVNPNFQSRGETVGVLLSQITNEAGFDVTETQALRWLNARHRKMVARSRCLQATLNLGLTVAGTASYAMDPDAIEVYEVQVGGTSFQRIGREDAANAAAGRLWITGAFYANADSAGVSELTLYGTPTESGDEITAYAAVMPPDLTSDDYPLIPIDFNDALVEGAIATGMARDIEQVAVADRFEARFDAACQELRRRVNARLGGTAVQLRVIGINA